MRIYPGPKVCYRIFKVKLERLFIKTITNSINVTAIALHSYSIGNGIKVQEIILTKIVTDADQNISSNQSGYCAYQEMEMP